MNGNSLLIDTNIALYLLNGDEKIADLLVGRDVYISFITELELLGFQDLEPSEIPAIEAFIDDCIIIELNQSIKEKTIEIKRKQKMKLPDAIIAASSIYLNMPLLSADKGFEKLEDIQFVLYEIE
jgi:predicted nucleic acid-binding protein